MDFKGPVTWVRGRALNSRSRGELETPNLGMSWQTGGKGEKPTFLLPFEAPGASWDAIGED